MVDVQQSSLHSMANPVWSFIAKTGMRVIAVSVLVPLFGIMLSVANQLANVAAGEPNRQDAGSAGKANRFAIVNATLHPMNGPVITRGRIVIQGDKIESIGNESLPIPQGIETIDASHLVITPGWIDLNSLLWMGDPNSDSGASDGSLWAADSLDPFSEDWRDVIAEGVTTVYVQPSSQGAMSGIGVAVGVAPGANGALEIRNRSAGLQMSMGNFSSNRDRISRYEGLKKSLQSVADYKKKWDEFHKAEKESSTKKESAEKPSTENTPAPSESRPPNPDGNSGRQRRGPPGMGERRGGPSEPPKDSTPAAGDPASAKENETKPEGEKPKETVRKPVKPERDIVKDRLVSVIDGTTPVRLEIHNANDLRYAMELRKAFPTIRWILEGADQLGTATEDVKSSRLPLVLGPWLNLDKQSNAIDKRLRSWQSLAADYEGVIGFQSRARTKNGSRLLREHIARANSLGVPSDKLLRAVTADAAKLIGCESSVGVLSAGFQADLVGFSGDPLDSRSVVQLVLSNGIIYKGLAASSPVIDPSEVAQAKVTPSATIPVSLPDSYVLKSMRMMLPEGMRAGSVTITNGKVVGPFRPEGDASNTTQDPKSTQLPLIDLGNAVLAPGLFSAYSTLGLEGQTRGTESDSSHLSAAEMHSFAPSELEALTKTGVLKVGLATSSSNTLAGQLTLMSLSPKRVSHQAGVASKIVLSEESRSIERFPSSLAGQVKFVRDFFDGRLTPSRLFVPSNTLEQFKQSRERVMKQMREGKQLTLFQVNEDAETEAALRLVREYKLRAAFYGSKSLSRYADDLSSLKISVIASPVTESDYPIVAKELVACHQKGIPLYFGGDNGIQLRTTASSLIREGMSLEEARKAMVYGSQSLFSDQGPFGFQDGASANFLAWSDDPLSLSSRLLLHIDQGKVVKNGENP